MDIEGVVALVLIDVVGGLQHVEREKVYWKHSNYKFPRGLI